MNFSFYAYILNLSELKGPSMMDFFVRESRAVVVGPMAIIRFFKS